MLLGRWQKYAEQLLPRWLRAAWMDRLWKALLYGPIELLDDDKIEAAKVGLLSHAPQDAVDHYARERQLDRLDGESTEQLRERALDAWTFWSELGPNYKLVEAFNLYTGLQATLWAARHWVDGYTGGVSDDDNADNWSRHWLVVELGSHPWTRPVVGPDLVVGPGLMVGVTMTETELSRIRRTYRRHRPSHMVGAELYIIFDATPGASVAAVNHAASSDYARIPLHRQMVGYVPLGMTVGPSMVVGHTYT